MESNIPNEPLKKPCHLPLCRLTAVPDALPTPDHGIGLVGWGAPPSPLHRHCCTLTRRNLPVKTYQSQENEGGRLAPRGCSDRGVREPGALGWRGDGREVRQRRAGGCRRGRGALGAADGRAALRPGPEAAPGPGEPPRTAAAPRDPRAPRAAAAGPGGRAMQAPLPSLPSFPSPALLPSSAAAPPPARLASPRLALSSPAEEWILEDFRRRDIFSAVSRPALFGMVRPAGARWPWAPPHADAALRPPAPPRPGCGGGRGARPGRAPGCPHGEPRTAPCARCEPSPELPWSQGSALVGGFEASVRNWYFTRHSRRIKHPKKAPAGIGIPNRAPLFRFTRASFITVACCQPHHKRYRSFSKCPVNQG